MPEKLNVADAPAHIAVAPVMLPVGAVVTVTVAVCPVIDCVQPADEVALVTE